MNTMSDTPEEMPDNATDRPLVTFALFAYNQEEYIREAIEGAFAQTYEPLEIILSDDCSSDRTFEIMQEMATSYDGPHKVDLRKNEKNLGLAEHVNRIVKSAKGDFIAFAAGDDISLSHRVEHTVTQLLKNPGASFCECAYLPIDESSRVVRGKKSVFPIDRSMRLEELINGELKGLTGAARTYSKAAIEIFSPLKRKCPTEDSPFVLRCLLYAPALFTSHPAIKRRSHDQNLSGVASMRRMALNEIWAQYLTDTNEAFYRGCIPKSVHVEVLQWIDRTAYSREIQQKAQNGAIRFSSEINSILRNGASTSLTRTERFNVLLKTSLRGWLKRWF